MTRNPRPFYHYFLKARDIILIVSDLWDTKSESEI